MPPKAFDKVWHDGLMHKIKLNLPANIHKLLESYLTGRKFIIKEGDFMSAAGVPQGGILGPNLYLIYASDMPIDNKIHTSTFADDTAFLSVHKSHQEASRQLQEYIHELEKWLKLWKI
ncbi:Probable RNA-directed DNA polymerase from transposon BS [Eumeta japonica]|uniref:Probable RNA-directed DNA polymerase from transposon BS n=1 Tax=Eumeta variegata TaxID=151549 RepID=A0A4C1T4C5_EUMVA|nr:Probable RNA-directed DNA polymerase from transposon BS [Eumeta japonica]